MSQPAGAWDLLNVSPEARTAAEQAAEGAGLPLGTWLASLIRDVNAEEIAVAGKPVRIVSGSNGVGVRLSSIERAMLRHAGAAKGVAAA